VGTTTSISRHSARPTAGHLCYTGRMAQRLHRNLECWTNGKFTNIDECLPKTRGAFRLRCDYQAVTIRWTIAPPASCHPEARSLLRRIYATSRPKSAVPQISTAHPPNFVTSDLALHSSNVRSSPTATLSQSGFAKIDPKKGSGIPPKNVPPGQPVRPGWPGQLF
jgi:hypothetical protein